MSCRLDTGHTWLAQHFEEKSFGEPELPGEAAKMLASPPGHVT